MSNSSISVGFFYRVFPSYRLAIMEELAKQSGIDLMVYYSSEPSYYSLKTVNPDDRFPNQKITMKTWRVGGQEFLYQPEAKGIVESGKHDVVVLPGNPRLLSNFGAMRAAKKKGIGIVWWSLGIMPSQCKTTLYLRQLLMAVPDSLVFYTEAEKAFFVSKGLPESKVFVAQNTISVDEEKTVAAKWSPDLLTVFAREKDFSGRKAFLFCGQLREKKKVDWLLSAFHAVRQKGYDYLLLLIGPDDTQGQVARWAADLNLGGCVRFLGPMYGAKQLAPWFLSARALVVPRAIGLAALHGFGFNVPCITSRDRRYQTPEAAALKDGYNSLMYEDGDIEDLSAKIIQLGENDRLQRELSENARRTMDEEYTLDKMVDGFVRAIRYAHEKPHGT